MLRNRFGFIFAAGALWIGACSANASPPEHEKTVAGVQAVERQWSEAFVKGDANYLGQLLDDGYVSVNGSGKVRTKAEVIDLAISYAAGNPAPLPDLPPSPVFIEGETAIVRHDNKNERSVDVFYYRDGRWHAWYSQHTRKSSAR